VSDAELATPFRQRADGAMKDAFLQEALTIATTKFIGLRREAFADFPEGERLRDLAREIKEATLQSLDRYTTRRHPRRRARSSSTSRGERARGWR